MKKYIKFLPFLLLGLSLVLNSCSNEELVSEEMSVDEFESFQKSSEEDIPETFIVFVNIGEEQIEGTVTLDWNEEKEESKSVLVSQNILDALGINQQDFDQKYQTATYSNEDDPNEGLSPHALCIETCNDKYTDENGKKIRGRGRCKGNCWVDTAIRIIEAIVPSL